MQQDLQNVITQVEVQQNQQTALKASFDSFYKDIITNLLTDATIGLPAILPKLYSVTDLFKRITTDVFQPYLKTFIETILRQEMDQSKKTNSDILESNLKLLKDTLLQLTASQKLCDASNMNKDITAPNDIVLPDAKDLGLFKKYLMAIFKPGFGEEIFETYQNALDVNTKLTSMTDTIEDLEKSATNKVISEGMTLIIKKTINDPADLELLHKELEISPENKLLHMFISILLNIWNLSKECFFIDPGNGDFLLEAKQRTSAIYNQLHDDLKNILVSIAKLIFAFRNSDWNNRDHYLLKFYNLKYYLYRLVSSLFPINFGLQNGESAAMVYNQTLILKISTLTFNPIPGIRTLVKSLETDQFFAVNSSFMTSQILKTANEQIKKDVETLKLGKFAQKAFHKRCLQTFMLFFATGLAQDDLSTMLDETKSMPSLTFLWRKVNDDEIRLVSPLFFSPFYNPTKPEFKNELFDYFWDGPVPPFDTMKKLFGEQISNDSLDFPVCFNSNLKLSWNDLPNVILPKYEDTTLTTTKGYKISSDLIFAFDEAIDETIDAPIASPLATLPSTTTTVAHNFLNDDWNFY